MSGLSSKFRCYFYCIYLTLCLVTCLVHAVATSGGGQQNEALKKDKPEADLDEFEKHRPKEMDPNGIEKLAQFTMKSLKQVNLDEKQLPIACVPGHVMLGVIFSVHKHLAKYDEYSMLRCGKDVDEGTIVAIQFLTLVLDMINKSSFHNTTVGAYMLNDCSSELVSMYQVERLFDQVYLRPETDMQRLYCSLNPNKSAPIIGIVQVSSESRFSPNIDNLLSVLNLPYVKVSAVTLTPEIIKNQVENLSVNTLSDNFILCDILKHIGWTYISLIYSDDYYELNQLEALTNYHGICIAKSRSVFESSESEHYEDIIGDISSEANANVVVLFCRSAIIMEGLVKAIENSNATDRFLLIISEDWLPYDKRWMLQRDVLPRILMYRKTVSEQALNFASSQTEKYFQMNAKNTKHKPWLREYWQKRFNCTIRDEADTYSTDGTCTEQENILQGVPLSKYSSQLVRVMDDSFFISNVFLNNYMQKTNLFEDIENQTRERVVNDLLNLTGSTRREYFEFLKNHTMDDLADLSNTLWDEYFEILYLDNLTKNFTLIGKGRWNDSLNRTVVTTDDTLNMNIQSVCSQDCGCGFRKVVSNPRTPCCWSCVSCRPREIVQNENCKRCEHGTWPDAKHIECKPIATEPIQWNEFEFLLSFVYAMLVMSVTAVTFYYFVKNRNTPVVKSSTRELSFMMLVSVFTTECIIFIIILMDSTTASCALIRITLLLSFTTMYAALLVKTVRIARLLALSKNEFPQMSMKFMSTKAQVAITCILVTLQIILLLFVLSIYSAVPTAIFYYDDDDASDPYAKLVCLIDDKIVTYNFSFVSLLVLLCTGCAVWTRNVPDNFNEAKYIGFCMYTTCLTWTGFGLTYSSTDYKTLTLCACSSTNALTTLSFLFFPKLYIMIFKPEKNDKKYFTTAKGIRFHKGNAKKKEMEQLTSWN